MFAYRELLVESRQQLKIDRRLYKIDRQQLENLRRSEQWNLLIEKRCDKLRRNKLKLEQRVKFPDYMFV